MSGSTPSQTVGPFFAIGLGYLNAPTDTMQQISANEIRIIGRVLDGEEKPVPDAQLELWHANPDGCYADLEKDASFAHIGALGFLRVATDELGTFCLNTTRPGQVNEADGMRQAPHIVVMVFMRGLLRQLYTRIYFADDHGHEHDRVLSAVPADRRRTLLAQPEANRPAHYHWDIHLQGKDETVFFDY